MILFNGVFSFNKHTDIGEREDGDEVEGEHIELRGKQSRAVKERLESRDGKNQEYRTGDFLKFSRGVVAW